MAGQYKRGTAIAINAVFGNTAGGASTDRPKILFNLSLPLAIISVLYRAQDAPRYILGGMPYIEQIVWLHILKSPSKDAIELMFIGIGVVVVTLSALNYARINAKREKLVQELAMKGIQYTPEQLQEMGDLAPDFRYTL